MPITKMLVCARRGCGRRFTKTRPWHKYCSELCGSLVRGAKRNIRVRKAMRMLIEQAARDNGVMGEATNG